MRRPAHLAIAVALVAVLALIAFELGRGALGDGALALPDPCTRTIDTTGEGLDAQTQRIALTALDRAACDTGSTREELLMRVARAVDDGPELPGDVQDALRDGLGEAIDAEEEAGRINAVTAFALRQAARFTPFDWLVSALRELEPLSRG